jgi:PAS domain S-box-containing protein
MKRAAEKKDRDRGKGVDPILDESTQEALIRERVEKKKVEASLADLERGFKLLFDHNPHPMWVVDLETLTYLDVNQAAVDHYGYSREEFLRMSLKEIRPAEEVPAFLKRFKLHRNSGLELKGLTTRHRKKDGTVINVELNSQLMTYRRRAARLVLAVDISERTRVEEAYREADRKYHLIFENAVEGIFQSSKNGRYLAANPAFARMLGYSSPEEICAIENISKIYVRTELRQAFLEQLEKHDVARDLDFECYRKDGSIIWIHINCRTVRDSEGNVLHYEGTCEDITERRRSEEQLRQMNLTLEKNMRELARSNAELQQFAYAASHDLQEPLRMVSSYLHLVAVRYRGQLDQDADEFIHFAVDGAKRMKLLIDDLLLYSRVGRSDQSLSRVDFNGLMEEAFQNLSFSILESQAKITFDPLPEIIGTRSQLLQLVTNLLSNAIKFRREAPLIHLSVHRKSDAWEFALSDSGIGFEMEYQDRIFRIFQRLHPREEYPGTGVGLAICKKIIDVHGGRIWAESKVGKGATFFFTLPVKPANESILAVENHIVA